MPVYKYDVTMTCSGCSGAVTRVLNKLKDAGSVEQFDVSLETQKVTVESEKLSEADILQTIQKTGKAAKVASD
ncbi:copper transport protein ATOX1-like protein [Gamsiella multidivaricata]|uniref:copper transport protein ATOX1-like protein n=1 Tax=Gamsiella multidivaricata TaxID=101098 RepID=UPI00221E70E6|nr:copper transport protein ATOX1-like protein [Gamsiella multidivaricata]KAI7829836.1 copper transport protein ATOX1-like protein [Gamsiella multidivaricata]